MLVDELGGKAVTRVLLGGLDVLVDKRLGLEPLIATLIWAGERSQASMVHHMHLDSIVRGISRRASSVGAGELWCLSRVMPFDMSLEVRSLCKSCPAIFAEVRS